MQSLAFSRVMAAWVSIGIAVGVYDACRRYITSAQKLPLTIFSYTHSCCAAPLYLVRYLGERKQWRVPLAAFQLNQEKLVRMLGNIQAMWLFGWRLCKLHGSGKMTIGQASLGKVSWWLSFTRTFFLFGA